MQSRGLGLSGFCLFCWFIAGAYAYIQAGMVTFHIILQRLPVTDILVASLFYTVGAFCMGVILAAFGSLLD